MGQMWVSSPLIINKIAKLDEWCNKKKSKICSYVTLQKPFELMIYTNCIKSKAMHLQYS